MNNQELVQELQIFADAHNLNMDVQQAFENIDAGDFITINQAIDSNDNVQIMKILQKYKAQVNENYSKFLSGVNLTESMNGIKELPIQKLKKLYEKFCKGAISDISHLSTIELQTLVYEDMNTSLAGAQSRASALANANTMQNQPNIQTQNKLKQNELLQKGNSGNMKVQVPGQNGNVDITDVVGIDVANNTDQSLVVTKDPNKQGNVEVFSINDVSPVNEEQEFQKLLDSIPALYENDELSVLTRPFPDWTDVLDEINDISKKPTSLDGQESVLGNDAMDNVDELGEIINFCRKMER